jgi:hypothetical protein
LQSLKALSRHSQIVELYEVIREIDENVYFVVRTTRERIYAREEKM